MTGNPATVAADMYSLGATIYALIAGNAAHERRKGEDLIAQYLRISTTGVPDMRPDGIPDAVCSAIERAMSLDPADRPASAEEFGRELQAAQRVNGLKPDAMAIGGLGRASTDVSAATNGGETRPPGPITSSIPPTREMAAHEGPTSAIGAPVAPEDPVGPRPAPPSGPSGQDEFSQVASLLRSGHAAETQPKMPSDGPDGPPRGPEPAAPPGPVPPPWRKPVALRIQEWFARAGQEAESHRPGRRCGRRGRAVGRRRRLPLAQARRTAVTRPPRATEHPRRPRGSRSPTPALRVMRPRPRRPTARSGSSAASEATAPPPRSTRATTPPSTNGRAATICRSRCSTRWRSPGRETPSCSAAG